MIFFYYLGVLLGPNRSGNGLVCSLRHPPTMPNENSDGTPGLVVVVGESSGV